MAEDRSAALLLRVWVEAEGAFRGRLMAASDVGVEGSEATTLAVVSSPEELVDALTAWLDDFVHDRDGKVDGGR